MDISSLGLRTDVALRQLSGSEVEDHGDHLVVRTPDNPQFWWGNFVVAPAAPHDEAGMQEWLERFETAFPGARHRTIAFDGITVDPAAEEACKAAGLDPELSVAMTATSVHAPPRPDTTATYRPLSSDEDWEQQVELSMDGEDPSAYSLEFSTARAKADRGLVEAGHGQWWGAFLDGRLVSSMGIFRASEGLARYQNVKTRPDARGRGIAGTLVEKVARHGFDELDARTLVMVADPGYLAIRIYRSVGFEDTETYLAAFRRPQD